MRNITPSRFPNRPKRWMENASKKTSEKFKEIKEKIGEGLMEAVPKLHKLSIWGTSGLGGLFWAKGLWELITKDPNLWSNLNFNIGAGLQGFSAAEMGWLIKDDVKTVVKYGKISAMVRDVEEKINAEKIKDMKNKDFDKKKVIEYIVYIDTFDSLLKERRGEERKKEIDPNCRDSAEALRWPGKYIRNNIYIVMLAYALFANVPTTFSIILFQHATNYPSWAKISLLALPFALTAFGVVAGVAEGMKEVRRLRNQLEKDIEKRKAELNKYSEEELRKELAAALQRVEEDLKHIKDLITKA